MLPAQRRSPPRASNTSAPPLPPASGPAPPSSPSATPISMRLGGAVCPIEIAPAVPAVPVPCAIAGPPRASRMPVTRRAPSVSTVSAAPAPPAGLTAGALAAPAVQPDAGDQHVAARGQLNRAGVPAGGGPVAARFAAQAVDSPRCGDRTRRGERDRAARPAGRYTVSAAAGHGSGDDDVERGDRDGAAGVAVARGAATVPAVEGPAQ